jgi:hypothetical protein
MRTVTARSGQQQRRGERLDGGLRDAGREQVRPPVAVEPEADRPG